MYMYSFTYILGESQDFGVEECDSLFLVTPHRKAEDALSCWEVAPSAHGSRAMVGPRNTGSDHYSALYKNEPMSLNLTSHRVTDAALGVETEKDYGMTERLCT